MVKLILLFGVVGSFKKLPICCSEVGTRVFKIISKMLKDNMSFQCFIDIEIFIEAIKIHTKVEQHKICIFRSEFGQND